ncbi:helix-turn-helix domain-containing protein [Kitasatospora sp. NPDC001095]
MNRTQLGAALRELRQASGKEAKAVARSAVMSPSKLSKIETGKVSPTVVDVERILTAIGVPEEVKAEYMAGARAQATEATAWRLIRRLGHHRKQQPTARRSRPARWTRRTTREAATTDMPTADAVLVLTGTFDPTADLVIEELNRRGTPVFRTDTAFPSRLAVAAGLDGTGAGWAGTLTTDRRTLDLSAVRSVYYRRPTAPEFPEEMPVEARSVAAAEARRGFGGLLSALPCRWLPPPGRAADAESSRSSSGWRPSQGSGSRER